MSTRTKFQAIRGTRDLLPSETALWNRVEQTAHSVFATFGFGEIRLPIFEETGLFARAVGGETDIVSKEMYTMPDQETDHIYGLRRSLAEWKLISGDFKDAGSFQGLAVSLVVFIVRAEQEKVFTLDEVGFEAMADLTAAAKELGDIVWGSSESRDQSSWQRVEQLVERIRLDSTQLEVGEDLSLRPEATASVCRAYIEHNMQQLPQPVKLYYLGPMFRRERPQKGRYRQFYQIGAEVLGGTDAPAIDAEVIEMVMTFFDKLELQGVQLDINSIGCKNCRPEYVKALKNALSGEEVKKHLGPDSLRRIETNPLRVLDSKLESEQAIIATLPKITEYLCADCATHYAAVKRQLELRGVIYRENWRLVRGLDYYMRTTFEITAAGLGSQNAVCGGGRYDGLVELLGGPPTKGIGFAIGEDRLILSLQESGKVLAQRGRDVYIAWMGDKAHATAIRAAKDLRNAGFSVELPPVEQKFGKALGQADKLAARFALILGDNEVAEGLWTLKTLADGSQQKLTESDLLEFLRKL